MKKFLTVSFFLILFAIVLNSADKNRGLIVTVEKLDRYAVAGKQYLVLIGIDKYTNWFPLSNPVNDAKEIKKLLAERYYIDEVYELFDENATKANISKLFVMLQEKLKVNDSVLIFYAGHGHLDKNTGNGYWIPVDAGLDKYEKEKWFPNAEIRGYINQFKSSHILLISDSCFSGDLLSPTRSITPEITSEYFKNAYTRTSRQVLTSGSLETVPDQSEFAQQFKMSLEKNNKAYLDPLMLYTDIRLGMKKSTPLYGTLNNTGHQDGASFLLFLKNEFIFDRNEMVTEENKKLLEKRKENLTLKLKELEMLRQNAKETRLKMTIAGGALGGVTFLSLTSGIICFGLNYHYSNLYNTSYGNYQSAVTQEDIDLYYTESNANFTYQKNLMISGITTISIGGVCALAAILVFALQPYDAVTIKRMKDIEDKIKKISFDFGVENEKMSFAFAMKM